ncbi:uncharacterized protein LOC126671160 [Mercurialis annua]|uniref:uncharacterized protein LOC126671160 n=1 Tax=Mercurialis annua TaxID=3986 RepID=UPI00215F1174|nr:uncharacterized protein LOC126671160 [Mercurialis annua]
MLAVWNIRGLNNPLKQSEIASLIRRNKLSVVGIVETRVSHAQFDNVWKKFGNKLPNWGILHNYCCSDMGRVWIIYNKDMVNIQAIKMHSQFIHCQLDCDGISFMCTFVYGSYVAHDRIDLWNQLNGISLNINLPWIILGDFNAVISNANRLGGNDIDVQAASEFQDWTINSNVNELPHSGNHYTWCNNQCGDNRIWRKLDWVFVNESWMNSWEESFYVVHNPGISDHSPLVVSLNNGTYIRRSPFRFFNSWCEHPNFSAIIDDGWKANFNGCMMYKVYQKLKIVRRSLRAMNKEVFADISNKVNDTKKLLNSLQTDIMTDPFNSHLQEEERAVCYHLQKLIR